MHDNLHRIDCARINQEIIKLNYLNPFPSCTRAQAPVTNNTLRTAGRLRAADIASVSGHIDRDSAARCIEPAEAITGAQQKILPEYLVHLEGDT